MITQRAGGVGVVVRLAGKRREYLAGHFGYSVGKTPRGAGLGNGAGRVG